MKPGHRDRSTEWTAPPADAVSGLRELAMKILNPTIKICSAALLAAAIWGCGTANDAAPNLSATGKHPALATWYVDHRAEYRKNPTQCVSCHGADLHGGISNVSCFNSGMDGYTCHAGGPRSVPHPLPFTAAALHGPAAKADLVYCQSCHGTAGGAGSNPRFTISIGSLANGCETCHTARTAHPPVAGVSTAWPGHADAGNIGNACALCHGATLGGGVGPACTTCHTSLAAGVAPIKGTCISCHAKPPATGNHAKHNALSGVTNDCATCHAGAGSGTQRHGLRGFANVSTAIDTRYAAKTGLGKVTGTLSCANVSCHGGVTTPAWGGSITTASQCNACHTAGTATQTPQYNSYYSGMHAKHLNEVGLICTDCHDMTKTNGSATHFSGLATPEFELLPRFTIRVPGYATTPGSCNPGNTPTAGTYSVTVCHGTKTW